MCVLCAGQRRVMFGFAVPRRSSAQPLRADEVEAQSPPIQAAKDVADDRSPYLKENLSPCESAAVIPENLPPRN